MAKYQTAPIPDEGYRVVLADPSWPWDAFSDTGLDRSPQAHYDVMDLADIKALWFEQDLGAKVHRDAWLFLWATWPTVANGAALEVIRAWGFEGVTGLPWVKTAQTGDPIQGMGYIVRSISEPLLIAKRGRPKVMAQPRGILLEADAMEEELRAAMFARRRLHSQKPDEQYELIETLAAGPGLELFARNGQRTGWHKSGNEVGKHA